jgi:hypothetical protein
MIRRKKGHDATIDRTMHDRQYDAAINRTKNAREIISHGTGSLRKPTTRKGRDAACGTNFLGIKIATPSKSTAFSSMFDFEVSMH